MEHPLEMYLSRRFWIYNTIKGLETMEKHLLTKEEAENILAATKLEVKFKRRCNYLVVSVINEIKEVINYGKCHVVLDAPEGDKIIFHIIINDAILPLQECGNDVLYDDTSWLIELR